MQIISNTAFLNSFLYSIQDTLRSLTPLQKRIVLIATAILASCTCLYYSVRYFRAKPEEKEKTVEKQTIEEIVTDLPAGPLTVDKIKSIEVGPCVKFSIPPRHQLTITLINGYKKSFQPATYPEFYLLISCAPKDTVKGLYRSADLHHHTICMQNQEISEEAATALLSKIFS